MKITMSEPEGPYSCELDTEVMRTEIREAYIGPMFISQDGTTLVVIERDNGFELTLSGTEITLNGIKVSIKED